MSLNGPTRLAHLKSTQAYELNKILFIKKQPNKILKKTMVGDKKKLLLIL